MSTVNQPARSPDNGIHKAYIIAWVCCLVFYFIQYAVRSAPSVMLDDLKNAFGLSTLGLSSLLGLYYYTYAAFALVAGASLDRWGAKWTIPLGTFILAVGTAMFGLGVGWMAQVGRLLQGAGAAFAFTGAVYLAAHGLPKRYLASAIGLTQCLGMLGGSAGQFAVGPLVRGPISWQSFWLYAGGLTAVLAVATFVVTPRQPAEERTGGTLLSMFAPYKIVLRNAQTWLCGLSAGLLFLPTTVGIMIWGVNFLHQGWMIDSTHAVERAATVPLGWVIGAPVLGYVSDRLGRRKPVLLAGIALMVIALAGLIWLRPNTAPPGVLGFSLGFGSGAAMIPYSIIKEVNPDEVKGSATGAINFVVFVLSAFAAPLYGAFLQHQAGGDKISLHVFDQGWMLMLGLVVIGAVLVLFLKETGSAARQSSSKASGSAAVDQGV